MVMKIGGLQKVSTIDYHGEICSVVFLWGCNFRCGFCYNPSLVVRDSDVEISQEEILEFLKKRKGKVDAVCVSGGEPLMSLDFDFVRKIREMGFKIKVDTNGSFPGRLREMIDLGLVDYVAMDIKGAKEDYKKIVNVNVDVGKIEESIKIVNDFNSRKSEVGSRKYVGEFRTTVVPGLHEIRKLVDMGEWMNEVCGKRPGRIFLQGFRRGEDMIDSSFARKKDVSREELLKMKGEIENLFEEVGVRC